MASIFSRDRRSELFRPARDKRRLQVAGCNIGIGVNAERHLAILFIGNPDVHQPEQLTHHLLRRLAVLPEILAEIQVAGNRDSRGSRGL